jgi:potassium-transporting ATPase KdpC subunit
MLLNLRRAVVVSAIFFVLLGLAYPLAETGIGQTLLSHRASGSIGANGSPLIGQQWNGSEWFHGRPDGGDPRATGGSNLGTRSQDLLETYRQRIRQLQQAGITPTPDLIAASGSGVDPDISADAAYAQVAAVSAARHLPEDQVRKVVADHVEGPQFGFLGSQRVNVLELNEALAALS